MATDAVRYSIDTALIALLTVFYDIPTTLIVLCAWILFRPEKIRRAAANPNEPLPNELPSGIVAAPSSEEFLDGLQKDG